MFHCDIMQLISLALFYGESKCMALHLFDLFPCNSVKLFSILGLIKNVNNGSISSLTLYRAFF